MMKKLPLLFVFLAVASCANSEPSTSSLADAERAYLSNRYAEALEQYRKIASTGNAAAMFQIGVMIEEGKGTKVDFADAAQWYKRASAAGSVAASKNLAHMYLDGRGVEKSFDEAARYYELAGESDANSLFLLAQFYWRGSYGERNPRKAVDLLKRSVSGGHVSALNTLGVAYQLGEGVQRDNSAAYAYFKRAAELGDPAAVHNLPKIEQLATVEEKRSAQTLLEKLRLIKAGPSQLHHSPTQ